MILQEIQDLMFDAHDGQFRRDGVTPYAKHPQEVAKILGWFGHTGGVIQAAAFLHDVIEDGDPEIDWASEILNRAGLDVLNLVMWVSHTEWRGERPPRALRKMLEHGKLRMAPDAAQTLKAADRLANIRDSQGLDIKFANLYYRETIELVASLPHADHAITDTVRMETRQKMLLHR